MNDNLQHHGIKGQKWGVRRFQKKDGSLTPEGKKRYDDEVDKESPKKESAPRSKGKQATLRLLEGVGDMAIAGFASAMLVKAGMMEVGVYGNMIANVVIGWNTVSDISDIYSKKD